MDVDEDLLMTIHELYTEKVEPDSTRPAII
jgi:hypothetical protein